MRNVVFSAPFPMETTMTFARAVRGLENVRLLGVFQQPPRGADAEVFDAIVRIDNGLDARAIEDGVRALEERFGPIHRLLGVLENIQVQLAVVRERLGIDGPKPEVAANFRDKARMKELLREADVPVARHREIRDAADAYGFVDAVGFPIVLKPPAGAGCRATYRIDSLQGLHSALEETQPSPERVLLAEEFLTGAEYTFETLTLGGKPVFSSIGRYYPGPLEAMRSPWIQWVVLLPREISGPEFDEVRRLGARTIEALGLEDGMTHMEWFRRPDGTVAVGEIAARPPGAQIVKLMGWAHGVDFHRQWARTVVDGSCDGPFERRAAVGVAFLRGMGQGKVAGVAGLEEAQQKMGELVVEVKLPRIGAPRQAGYEGEGWVIVRHPSTAVVQKAILELITTVKVTYA